MSIPRDFFNFGFICSFSFHNKLKLTRTLGEIAIHNRVIDVNEYILLQSKYGQRIVDNDNVYILPVINYYSTKYK